MSDKLIYILPVITLLLFGINCLYRKHTVQSFLIFVLLLLPLMGLKITPEKYGAVTVFDATCVYSLIFMFKEFVKINTDGKNIFYLFLFIFLIITVFLGGLASEFPKNTYLSTIKILPIFIFGRFFITECGKDKSFHSKAIKALKISYICALSFLFIQMLVGLKFTFYPSLGPNTIDPIVHIVRYPGVFYDSQASGQYLAIGSFLFLYFDDSARKKEKIFGYLIFFLAIIGITFAGSRSAFGALGIGIIIVFLLAGQKYRIYGISIFLLGLVIFYATGPHFGVFSRSKTLDEDYLFRQSLWSEAYKIAEEHPYLGIGGNNYQPYVMKHNQDQYLEILPGDFLWFDQPENGYLKILVEFGFIGFILFALFLIIPLVSGFFGYLRGNLDTRICFLFASLLGWMVAFNTVFSIADNRILIIVASVVCLIIAYPSKKYFIQQHD